MRKLIDETDLRKLLAGAAGVAVVGLLCGAAMQPQLRAPGDVEGQQIQAGVSGVRTPYDGTIAYSSYANGVPDYVIGTDWLQPPQYDLHQELPEPEYHDYASSFDEPAYEPAVVATWEEPPREPPRYPSIDGGSAYSVEAHAASAVGVEPVETSVDPDVAEMAAATPG